VSFNPLVIWVWIGGLIVMWPQAEKKRPLAGYVSVLEPGHVDGAEAPSMAGV
jgi:hypothetical protein